MIQIYLTAVMNCVPLTGLTLGKSQKGLPDANCFDTITPGLESAWAHLPKDFRCLWKFQDEDQGEMDFSTFHLYWLPCFHVAYLLCFHGNL